VEGSSEQGKGLTLVTGGMRLGEGCAVGKTRPAGSSSTGRDGTLGEKQFDRRGRADGEELVRRGRDRPAARRTGGGDEQMVGGNPSSPSYPSRQRQIPRRASAIRAGNHRALRALRGKSAAAPKFRGLARASASAPPPRRLAPPPRRLEAPPRRLAPPNAETRDYPPRPGEGPRLPISRA
jgi:hypothetical protein